MKLRRRINKWIKKCFYKNDKFKRFRKTDTFQLVRNYRYDRFISKNVKKGDYSSIKAKKMHYILERKGMLTNDKKKIILKKIFKAEHGYELDFDNPKTYNEKIMWLKLYYQNPLITKCCDKFAMKDYVSNLIGEEYVVPVIKSWTNPDHIDFDKLPNQFVIKVNWSSGYLMVVKDKSLIDTDKLRKKLKLWMRPYRNSYYQTFNWGYKDMPPMIFAEEYIEQVDGEVYDYKFFCMNGKVNHMLVITGRMDKETETTQTFYDRDFNFLNFTQGNRPHAKDNIVKPKYYDKMIELAEKLAAPFPFVRVDFYEVENKLYVGEMTFYPGGGLLHYSPIDWDEKLGKLIKLPAALIQDEEDYYDKITPRECFMIENSITPAMQRNFSLQKAYKQMGYLPDLSKPVSFNEKIIWLALNYKNDLIKECVDKYSVKEFVRDKVGEEHVVPTYGIYETVDEIKLEELPNKFVCKSTVGWGGNEVLIVDNKVTCCFDYLKVRMSKWLYPWSSYYYQNLCITDEKVMPRIIIEELLEAEEGLNDYKVYCCNGEPKFVLVVMDRSEKNQTRTFMDLDWNYIPVYRKGKKTAVNPKKPHCLEKMIELSRKLSADFPLVRIDFYEVNGRVYVGEMTFTPGMFLGFRPIEMDYKLGEYLDLSEYM